MRLVSGLPTDVERRRWFLVIQVCIDDSATGRGDHTWFILGGYLARARVWKSFADDWQKILRERPGLDFIKAQEAYRCTGQFHRWLYADRDKRMMRCKTVIEKYVTKRVSFAVGYSKYDRVLARAKSFGRVDDGLENPYTFALVAILTQTVGDQLVFSKTREKIEFVFDCGFEDRARLELGYKRMMTIFDKNLPKHAVDLIAREPLFRPDHEFLPLQAADLAAWGTRRVKNGKSLPSWLPTLPDRTNLDIDWTEQDLREVYLSSLRGLRERLRERYSYFVLSP